MAEIAIWAATCATINAINIVKTWIIELRDFVREVREADKTMRRMENERTIFEADFELWAEMWGIHQNVSKRYLLALWGRTSRNITQQLELIRDAHQEIEQIFRKFHGQGAIPPSPAAQTARPQLKGLRESVTFVTSKGPEIIRKLESTQSQMAAVKKLSKDAFQICNGIRVLEDILPRSILEQTQRNLLFQLVYESRLASRELYEICYRAREDFRSRDLDLEIDIFRQSLDATSATTQDALPLRYQFLFTLMSKLYELSVEGPFSSEGDRDPRRYAGVAPDFYQACLATARMSQSYELLKVSSIADARLFRLSMPPESRRISEARSSPSFSQDEGHFKSLISLLYDLRVAIDDEPADRFPGSERLRFAFKVAECGLFLSGTSWLVDLASSNIRSARDYEHDRHFLLETKAFRESYNNGHFGEFAAHVYAIGILLAEIGIGRRIGNILRRSRTVGYTFHLYQAGTNLPSNPYEEPESVVLDTLSINMGKKYAEVVKTCLESRESWRQARELTAVQRPDKYVTMLEEYYSEVYLPLRSLQKQVDLEFNLKLVTPYAPRYLSSRDEIADG